MNLPVAETIVYIGDAGETGLAAGIMRWTTVILFTFIVLEFMGACGLGGRAWAARQLEKAHHAIAAPKTGKSGS